MEIYSIYMEVYVYDIDVYDWSYVIHCTKSAQILQK